MNVYHKRRAQVAINAVYRSTALFLRHLGVTEAEAAAACEFLASQAPEKFSRAVFMEVFEGGQEVAEKYRVKDLASLERAREDTNRRHRVNHLRNRLNELSEHLPKTDGDQGRVDAGGQEDPPHGAESGTP